MKKILSIIVLFFVFSSIALSQRFPVDEGGNFYDVIYNYYNKPTYVVDTGEGGMDNMVERAVQIWAPRLYPHGDFTIAANAMMDYVQNYTDAPSGYDPDWTCLGPNGMPGISAVSPNLRGVGRITRLAFDPDYDGINNKTIYAASSFGGLWRSENDGLHWNLVNTDHLPITGVADVAVCPTNRNILFIGTGYADWGFPVIYSANFGSQNPLFTCGMYRSTDYGNTWEEINNNFINHFTDGGTIRKLLTDPSDPDIVYVATTKGIFKTTEAITSSNPYWDIIFEGMPARIDVAFRGLELKPGNPNVVYASGIDIYRSDDQGDTWISMTEDYPGINFNELGDNYIIHRINIAVTPANPEILYAYLIGDVEYTDSQTQEIATCDQGNIFGFNLFGQYVWTELFEQIEYGGGTNAYSHEYLAITVHPENEHTVFFGHTILKGSLDILNEYPTAFSEYWDSDGFHVDIHALAFQPNVSNPMLFCGNHGGVCVKTELSGTQSWESRCGGLECATIWRFDDNEIDPSAAIIGTQDCGIVVPDRDGYFEDWYYVEGGDGYATRIDDTDPNTVFCVTNDGKILRGIYSSNDVDFSDEGSNLTPEDAETGGLAVLSKMFPMVNHPVTKDLYFGFSEVYERLKTIPESGDDWTEIWEQDSDLGKTTEAQWRRQIIDLEIPESDPNSIYVVTLGLSLNDGSVNEVKSGVWKAENGPINGNYNGIDSFELLEIPGYDPVTEYYPVVTGLAVDPENADRIWISYTGYYSDYKVQYSSDGGNIWTDASGSLDNLPVNTIVYEKGTNDRLYIGTDVGLFIKNGPTEDWQRYGSFPNVRVVGIKINYVAGKIRVATYGRGMWEGNLPDACPVANPQNLEIDENTEWYGLRVMNQNIVVKEDYTLTIFGDVYLGDQKKIIVERGAKLIVDGGKISKNCDGGMWHGIEVWGNSLESQFPENIHQGLVEVKNYAEIIGSQRGIYTENESSDGYRGGIVKISNSIFTDNGISVEILPYTNFNPGNPEQILNNISYIENAKFNRSENLTYSEYDQTPIIKLSGVKGISITNSEFKTSQYFHYGFGMGNSVVIVENCDDIEIKGCKFLHTKPFTYSHVDRGTAIYSFNSDIKIGQYCLEGYQPPCSVTELTEIEKFNYGVKALFTDPIKTIEVSNSRFSLNMKSIYISASNYSYIKGNDIGVGLMPYGSEDTVYGIYMDGCTRYTIEENDLYRSINGGPDVIGMIINNSGGEPNEIYRNNFSYIDYGIVAQNQNRNPDNNEGLLLHCNSFSNYPYRDISVTFEGPNLYEADGIANHQGSSDPLPENMAGNLFFIPYGQPVIDFDDMYNEANDFIYYFPENVHPDYENVEPKDFTELTIDDISVYFEDQWTYENGCPPTEEPGGDGSGEEGMKSALAETQLKIDSTENLLSLLIDGGDTEELQTDVDNSIPPETIQVYNELMQKSPYLSDTVVSTAIEKENVLPNAMIRDIMVANPHTAKSNELMDKLDERWDPLPQYMKAQILQGKSIVSIKEETESSLAEFKLNKAKVFNSLVRYYLNETVNPVASLDSLTALLSAENSLPVKYNLAFLHLNNGNLQEGMNVINNIPLQFNLDNQQLAEHQKMEIFFDLIHDLLLENKSVLEVDSVQMEVLTNLEISNTGIASVYARNILMALGEIDYEEPIILPDILKSSEA
ncbi:MAG: hypothetical protein K8R53_08020, partial [Bacteroidales bacterium]|nr:hypothetical protein [Bacteroidales bacterium]